MERSRDAAHRYGLAAARGYAVAVMELVYYIGYAVCRDLAAATTLVHCVAEPRT